jgi:hypothetical protein
VVWYLDNKKEMIDPKDICVLVSYNEHYSDMANLTVNHNIKQYCEKHGYTLWIDQQNELDNNRSSHWQKIKTSINILPSFDWVFFIDTDCLIMNSNIKLESLIDDDYSFIVPNHNVAANDNPITNIEGIHNVITSQFLVKNDTDGLAILQAIWDAEGWPEEMDISTFDYEGRQMRIVINSLKFKDKIKIIEEKLLNRFWYINNPYMVMHFKGVNNNVWQAGDFIVHVTGYSKEDRIRILSDLNYFSNLHNGYE